jgi:hypothetical protein
MALQSQFRADTSVRSSPHVASDQPDKIMEEDIQPVISGKCAFGPQSPESGKYAFGPQLTTGGANRSLVQCSADLAQALESSKQRELVIARRDKLSLVLSQATEIVKQFIREHECVLYGGTAIDYALRLRGSKIYSDDELAFPDLDFYIWELDHAYQLADQLANALPDANVRVIGAQHVGTLRVDVGENHFIADMTLRYESARLLPTVEFEGMRCLHPMVQRMDLHAAFAFPFDNPPREVAIERWNKDSKRFAILDEHYPVEAQKVNGARTLQTYWVNAKDISGPITGCAAYCMFRALFTKKFPDDDKPLAAAWDISEDALSFSAPEPVLDLVTAEPYRWSSGGTQTVNETQTMNAQLVAAEPQTVNETQTIDSAQPANNATEPQTIDSAQLGDEAQSTDNDQPAGDETRPQPEKTKRKTAKGGSENYWGSGSAIGLYYVTEGEIRGSCKKTRLFHLGVELPDYQTATGKLLSLCECASQNSPRVACVQQVLRHLLSLHFAYKFGGRAGGLSYPQDENIAGVYLQMYDSLLYMLKRVFADGGSATDDIVTAFSPSLEVYGRLNRNAATAVSINRAKSDMRICRMIPAPNNYRVEAGRVKPHPSFDMRENPFFG